MDLAKLLDVQQHVVAALSAPAVPLIVVIPDPVAQRLEEGNAELLLPSLGRTLDLEPRHLDHDVGQGGAEHLGVAFECDVDRERLAHPGLSQQREAGRHRADPLGDDPDVTQVAAIRGIEDAGAVLARRGVSTLVALADQHADPFHQSDLAAAGVYEVEEPQHAVPTQMGRQQSFVLREDGASLNDRELLAEARRRPEPCDERVVEMLRQVDHGSERRCGSQT